MGNLLAASVSAPDAVFMYNHAVAVISIINITSNP